MPYRVCAVALALGLCLALACEGGGGSPSHSVVLLPTHLPGQAVNLDDIVVVLKRRFAAFGVQHASVKSEETQLLLTIPQNISNTTIADLTRVGLLEFCEPLQDALGNVGVAQQGSVQYQAGSCEPVRDAQGNVVVSGGSVSYQPWNANSPGLNIERDQIVWTPALGDLNGTPTVLTSKYMKPNTSAASNPITEVPLLQFEMTDDGALVFGSLSGRLSQRKLPLATFLDGEPVRGDDGHIIAPTVESRITSQAQITGLSLTETKRLSGLLNSGTLPVPLQVLPVLVP